MPCIEKPRVSTKFAPTSYCGKMLSIDKKSFKNVEEAYKGNEPICPNCRNVLGLQKKEIKKSITSIKIFKKEINVFFNKNKKNVIPVFFDLERGYYIKDYQDIEEEFFEEINQNLSRFTKEQLNAEIKRMRFKESDLSIIEKVILSAKENKINLSQSEIKDLEKIKDNFKIHILSN